MTTDPANPNLNPNPNPRHDPTGTVQVSDASTDAELLDALADPSARQRAWSVLVERHSARMYAVARSFWFDARTSEDLVQTAWLRLVERYDQLRDRDALGPWLCTIVRNDARKLVTRRRTTPTADLFDRVADDGPDVDTRLIHNEQIATTRLAFSRLGEECQQLLRLLCVDPPLSYDEIAAATGRPRGSLGPTRQRCLEQLRRLIASGPPREANT